MYTRIMYRRKLVCLLHTSTTKISIYLSCLLFPFHLIGNVIIQMCTILIYLSIYICFISNHKSVCSCTMMCRPNFHLEIQQLGKIEVVLNRHLSKFGFQCYSLPILFWLEGGCEQIGHFRYYKYRLVMQSIFMDDVNNSRMYIIDVYVGKLAGLDIKKNSNKSLKLMLYCVVHIDLFEE